MKHISKFPLNENVSEELYKVEDMQWFKDQSKADIKAINAKKFTYKTDKPTGKWKSFSSNSYYVKLKNVKIGQIWDTDGKWTVSFMLIKDDPSSDGNTNCPWRWAKFKKQAP